MIFANDSSCNFEFTLKSLCKGSPYGARIFSYYTAYYGKKYDFLDFWVQKDINGRGICALCRYYSTLIICGKTENIKEIIDFIKMLQPAEILCDESFNLFPFKLCSQGETMKFFNNAVQYFDCFDIVKISSDMKKLREIYSLLNADCNSKNALPDFESYFLDISHRIRHGVSDLYAVLNDCGQIVATAAIVAKTDDCAVIGCVATHPEYRRKGIAANIVGKITDNMLKNGKAVFLHREREIKLYEILGYKTIGKWRVYGNGFYHT